MLEDMNKSNIKKVENKINIYICFGEMDVHIVMIWNIFLDDLGDEYKNKFNLYTFEVWYNVENANLMILFTSYLNDSPECVPYLIIGKHAFSGYSTNMHEDIKKYIDITYEERFDINEELLKDY